jgi:hypothetical protein
MNSSNLDSNISHEKDSLNNKINSYNINSRRYQYKSDISSDEENNSLNKLKTLNQNGLMKNNNTSYKNNESANVKVNKNQDIKYIEEENEFHFQTKIRNSGFWGGVTLRKGTWLVIIGAVLMSISICVISVFWRWWYGPEINMPCRVIGITLLVVGLFSVLLGLISNWLVSTNSSSKHFIGSPPRSYSWILLISIISLIIASVLMAIYYTYWHNRWVNTPLISISIILFFFGSIGFIVSVTKNFKELNLIKKNEKSIIEIENDENNQNEYDHNFKQDEQIDENQNESKIELKEDDQKELKKNFRKKMVKLTPRNQNHVYLLSKNNQI